MWPCFIKIEQNKIFKNEDTYSHRSEWAHPIGVLQGGDMEDRTGNKLSYSFWGIDSSKFFMCVIWLLIFPFLPLKIGTIIVHFMAIVDSQTRNFELILVCSLKMHRAKPKTSIHPQTQLHLALYISLCNIAREPQWKRQHWHVLHLQKTERCLDWQSTRIQQPLWQNPGVSASLT